MSRADKAALAKGAAVIRKAELESKQSTATAMSGWRKFKKIHPACDVFPLMSPGDLRALADDIQANGLKFPIETRRTNDGLFVIDGRNRLDALELLGIQIVDDKGEWKHPKYIHYGGKRTDAEIAAEVITYNLRRRDLSQSQRAIAAAKLANMSAGNPTFGSNPATLPNRPVSQSEAAALTGVSERSVRAAKKVLREAPEYVGYIESGEATVGGVLKEKSKQTRKKGIPKMKDTKRAMANAKRAFLRLKNSIVYDDERDGSTGKLASELLSELIEWLQRELKGLTKGRRSAQ